MSVLDDSILSTACADAAVMLNAILITSGEPSKTNWNVSELDPSKDLILIRDGHQFGGGPLLERAAPCRLILDFLHLFLAHGRSGVSPTFVSSDESGDSGDIFVVLDDVAPWQHAFII